MAIVYTRSADPIGDTGPFSSRMIFGDFDNDGDVDILYQNGNTAGQGIGYKRNNGNGTFTDFATANAAGTPFTTIDFTGIQVTNSPLFVVDIDGDGDVDIVNRTPGTGTQSILRNDGGTFVTIADPIGDTGAFDSRMIFIDANRDGFVDILYQNGNTPGVGIGVKLNNTRGAFIDIPDATAVGSPFRNVDFTGFNITNSVLFVVDYDNDGDPDIVNRLTSAGTQVILRNQGSAFFNVADTIGDTGPFDSRVLFGDFDSDGDIDLLYQNGNTAGQGIGYKRNDGAGTFTDFAVANAAGTPFAGVDFTNVQVSSNLTAIDIDNDGDIDIVDRTNGGSSVFLQAGAPPKLASSSPVDNAVNVALNANLTLTFTESVTKGSGSIQIVRISDNSVVETIAIASAQVTGSGTTWTIDPAITLGASTAYALRLAPGTFVDADGAIFKGIADNTTLNFTTAASQPPVVTTGSGTTTFVEGANVLSTPVVVDPSITVTDADSPTLRRVVVSITGNFQRGQDFLALVANTATMGDIRGSYYDFAGELTLSGTGTLAQWQAALRAVTYTNASDTPNTAARTISFVANDGSENSLAATRTVAVVAVNDLPVVSDFTPGPTLSFTEGIVGPSPVFPVAREITLRDADSTLVGATVTVSNGVVGEDILGFVGNPATTGNISGVFVGLELRLTSAGNTATIAQWQEALRSVTYTNDSEPTNTIGRTVTFVATDQGGSSAPTSVFVVMYNADDLPVAVADTAATSENVSITGTTTAGTGLLVNDTDRDGGRKEVVAVNGVAANVGTEIRLPSGALLTVQSNGNYTYKPSGAFDYLVSPATAAANPGRLSQITDSFTYTLNGNFTYPGTPTPVTITITGVDSAGDAISGSAGNDTVDGTGIGDFILLTQGGSDVVSTGAGDDAIFVGAAWDPTDRIDGGAGSFDQIGVRGDYSAGLTLSATSLTGVEMLVFLPGSDTRFGAPAAGNLGYAITTNDANVAAGQTLVVQGNALRAGETLAFDGRAETDGTFTFYAGLGADILTGGQRDDAFYFGDGRFGALDRVDGQGGTMDQIGLQGNYSGANAITFGASQLSGIEAIVLLSGADTRFGGGGLRFGYTLTMNDANAVGPGPMMIQGNTLRAGEVMTINASAETSTPYLVYGGAAADTITGGAGADQIWGRGGGDMLRGGAGNDIFGYLAGDSGGSAIDRILDFTAGDRIDLSALGVTNYTAGTGFDGIPGQVRVRSQGNGLWLVEANTDADPTSVELQIFVTAGAYTWSAADFRFAGQPAADAAPIVMDSHGITL